MTTAISVKLTARVIASVDLDAAFPSPAFKGLVAFDIYVDKGEISIGKKVSLMGQFAKEEVTIRGIELRSDASDPNKVRILCSKPTTIKIPLLESGRWAINEE
jgi:hypothetical protein